MPALWVLAVLALLVTLILSARLRLLLSFKDGALTVKARVGPLTAQLFPPPEPKPAAKVKKASKKKETPKEKPKTRRRSGARRLIRAVKRLWDPVTKTLSKLAGAVRVDPCNVRLVYGGRDEPADAAISCGKTLAAVWTVMPALERLCRIPRPSIFVDVDFNAPELDLQADVGLTLRVWALLAAGVPLLALLRESETERTDSHGKE